MTTRAQEAYDVALDTLGDIAKNPEVKTELRIEAAKIILNRPRFFVDKNVEEK